MSHRPDWTKDGDSILAPERLTQIHRVLDDVGPIIVQHWFYYGARAPDLLAFNNSDDFDEYLKTKVAPGDAIDVWSFDACCKVENALARAKYPDAEGRVPLGGAY